MNTSKETKCAFCGDYLTEGEVGAYKKIEGWVPVRSAGGYNTITMYSEPLAWAHRGCIELQRQKKQNEISDRKLF